MLRRFRLKEPESVDKTSDLLTQYKKSTKIYTDGTELLLAMKEGLVHYERLVNIKKIRSLDQIATENGFIHIGSLSTHRKLIESSLLRKQLPALVGMESDIANTGVREVGTLDGTIYFDTP